MSTTCVSYTIPPSNDYNHSYEMRNHVFISKAATRALAEFVTKEYWGKSKGILYKYLDYTWRFQLIDNYVKQFTYNLQNRLVFNTGLFIRNTQDYLYLILIPNDAYHFNNQVKQAWQAIPEISFVNESELINKYGINKNDLPKKTNVLKNREIDSEYHQSYNFFMNTFDRVKGIQSRILYEFGDDSKNNINISINELETIVENSVNKSLKLIKKDPKLIGKQIFVETHVKNGIKITKSYRLELLLPLLIKINGKKIHFALVLRPNHFRKTYEGMTILTKKMAYSNARLVSTVKTPWLKLKNYQNNKLNSPNTTSLNFDITKNIPKNNILNSTTLINENDIKLDKIFQETVYDNNPFFYIATILPIQLPKIENTLNINNVNYF